MVGVYISSPSILMTNKKGKSKASVNQNQPSSKLGMADVRKKVKQKKIKIMHPKSRKAARVQRSLLRDDKMARQKQVAKGDALLKGERIAWLKEEMVEGKAQYTYVRRLGHRHSARCVGLCIIKEEGDERLR